ncbi:MAG: PspA-associated protein PspAB [Nitrososphaeraceae archaeon]
MSFFRKIRKGIYYDKNKSKIDSEAIFSLSSATITLETKLGLKPTGRCALAAKSASGMYFNEMKDEIERFLNISKPDFELEYRTIIDSYGYLWVILNGRTIEDILAAITAIGDTIQEKGFSSQLLASIFELSREQKSNDSENNKMQYLIYNYKSNKFYPFVPFFGKKTRDTENEMRIMASIQDEIPFERDMAMWYPLWDLPF